MNLQDTYAPNLKCFGCGPANEKGLRIKSVVKGDFVECIWRPEPHHQAYENMLSGGICGTLLDCHSNWAAAHYLMKRADLQCPSCTVTAKFAVSLNAVTPMDCDLVLQARVHEISDRKAIIKATLSAQGVVTATCEGVFVAVKEGHPAYHRW